MAELTPEEAWIELININLHCRTGCKTQDHASYAECLQAAAIQIGKLK